MKLRTLDNLDLKGKTVFLRCDLNVPLDNKGKVTDITKIKRHKVTIDELINKKAKILVISHLGRPKGKEVEELSLNKISDEFVKVMNIKEITVLPFCRPNIIKSVLEEKQEGSITLMENIRFYPEEEQNDESFARELSAIGDYYINDAFSVSHRKHLSTFSLSKFLPSYLGRSLELELTMLSKIYENIDKPVMAIIGGSKISTKINILTNLVKKMQTIVIVGAMANNFIKHKGNNIGKSLYEKNQESLLKDIIKKCKKNNCKLIIPEDVIVAKSYESEPKLKSLNKINDTDIILDIGENTIKKIYNIINESKTILWNGPVGYFELEKFSTGSNKIAKKITENTKNKSILSIAGGGDTVAAINKFNCSDGFTYISTAGGAFLELLEGKILPGIKALEINE